MLREPTLHLQKLRKDGQLRLLVRSSKLCLTITFQLTWGSEWVSNECCADRHSFLCWLSAHLPLGARAPTTARIFQKRVLRTVPDPHHIISVTFLRVFSLYWRIGTKWKKCGIRVFSTNFYQIQRRRKINQQKWVKGTERVDINYSRKTQPHSFTTGTTCPSLSELPPQNIVR